MNKKIIIGAAAAVLLIGGVTAGVAINHHNQVVASQKALSAAEKSATLSVDQAEKSLKPPDIAKAQTLVDKLSSGKVKTALEGRIVEVKTFNTAVVEVDKAYQSRSNADIQTAESTIKKLTPKNQKPLNVKVTSLKTGIAEIATATTAVAELDKLQTEIKPAASQSMNLEQIAKGDFSSIEGTWTTDIPDVTNSIIVTANTMKTGSGAILSAATLTLNKPQLLKGTLYAMSVANQGSRETDLEFLPQGVSVDGQFIQSEKATDNSKERIALTYMGGTAYDYYKTSSSSTKQSVSQSQIDKAAATAQAAIAKINQTWAKADKAKLQDKLNTAKQAATSALQAASQPATPAPTPAPAAQSMNLSQISTGNLSSVVGTWSNAAGQSIEFTSDNRVMMNGNDVTSGDVMGQTYSMFGAPTPPKTLPDGGLMLSMGSSGIELYPKGTSGASQDCILAGQNLGNGIAGMDSQLFYKK